MYLSAPPAFGWQTKYCECPATTIHQQIDLSRQYAEMVQVEWDWTEENHLQAEQYVKQINRHNRKLYNFNLIYSYLPLASTVDAIFRLHAYTAGPYKNMTNKANHVIRSNMQIAQLGILLLIIDSIVTLFRVCVAIHNRQRIRNI